MRSWALGLMAAMTIAASGNAETLREASITLDEANVRPFFDRLTTVIDGGFGPGERDGTSKMIDGMKAGDERGRQFSVKYEGREVPLRIHAVMGSGRAARVEFLTSPELAHRIQKERNIFLDALDR